MLDIRNGLLRPLSLMLCTAAPMLGQEESAAPLPVETWTVAFKLQAQLPQDLKSPPSFLVPLPMRRPGQMTSELEVGGGFRGELRGGSTGAPGWIELQATDALRGGAAVEVSIRYRVTLPVANDGDILPGRSGGPMSPTWTAPDAAFSPEHEAFQLVKSKLPATSATETTRAREVAGVIREHWDVDAERAAGVGELDAAGGDAASEDLHRLLASVCRGEGIPARLCHGFAVGSSAAQAFWVETRGAGGAWMMHDLRAASGFDGAGRVCLSYEDLFEVEGVGPSPLDVPIGGWVRLEEEAGAVALSLKLSGEAVCEKQATPLIPALKVSRCSGDTADIDHGIHRPTWTPDGESLIGHGHLVGGQRLFRISLTGGGIAKLCDEPGIFAAVSPGGRWVACQSSRAGAQSGGDIYVVPSDGKSGAKRVVGLPYNQYDASWLSETELVFASEDDISGKVLNVFKMDTVTQEVTRLTPRDGKTAYRPCALPFGNRIAYIQGGQLWMAEGNGDKPQQLTRQNWELKWPPTWSPDGQMIALGARQQGRPCQDIFVYDLRRKALFCVLQTDWEDWFPTWSPQGDRIAFVRNRTDKAVCGVLVLDLPPELLPGPVPLEWASRRAEVVDSGAVQKIKVGRRSLRGSVLDLRWRFETKAGPISLAPASIVKMTKVDEQLELKLRGGSSLTASFGGDSIAFRDTKGALFRVPFAEFETFSSGGKVSKLRDRRFFKVRTAVGEVLFVQLLDAFVDVQDGVMMRSVPLDSVTGLRNSRGVLQVKMGRKSVEGEPRFALCSCELAVGGGRLELRWADVRDAVRLKDGK